MSQENVDVARRMFDAFNEGDVDTVIATFGEGCLIEEPRDMPDTPPTGFRGHDGVREWMANLRGVAGVRFEPRSFRTGADVVIYDLASHGRGTEGGVPVEWTTFAVLQMRDGKIARARAFLSEAEALEAAGLSEGGQEGLDSP